MKYGSNLVSFCSNQFPLEHSNSIRNESSNRIFLDLLTNQIYSSSFPLLQKIEKSFPFQSCYNQIINNSSLNFSSFRFPNENSSLLYKEMFNLMRNLLINNQLNTSKVSDNIVQENEIKQYFHFISKICGLEYKRISIDFLFNYFKRYLNYLNTSKTLFSEKSLFYLSENYLPRICQSFEKNEEIDSIIYEYTKEYFSNENTFNIEFVEIRNLINEKLFSQNSQNEIINFIKKMYSCSIKLLEENCKKIEDFNINPTEFKTIKEIKSLLNKNKKNIDLECLSSLFVCNEEKINENIQKDIISFIHKSKLEITNFKELYFNSFIDQIIKSGKKKEAYFVLYLIDGIAFQLMLKAELLLSKLEVKLIVAFCLIKNLKKNQQIRKIIAKSLKYLENFKKKINDQYKFLAEGINSLFNSQSLANLIISENVGGSHLFSTIKKTYKAFFLDLFDKVLEGNFDQKIDELMQRKVIILSVNHESIKKIFWGNNIINLKSRDKICQITNLNSDQILNLIESNILIKCVFDSSQNLNNQYIFHIKTNNTSSLTLFEKIKQQIVTYQFIRMNSDSDFNYYKNKNKDHNLIYNNPEIKVKHLDNINIKQIKEILKNNLEDGISYSTYMKTKKILKFILGLFGFLFNIVVKKSNIMKKLMKLKNKDNIEKFKRILILSSDYSHIIHNLNEFLKLNIVQFDINEENILSSDHLRQLNLIKSNLILFQNNKQSLSELSILEVPNIKKVTKICQKIENDYKMNLYNDPEKKIDLMMFEIKIFMMIKVIQNDLESIKVSQILYDKLINSSEISEKESLVEILLSFYNSRIFKIHKKN